MYDIRSFDIESTFCKIMSVFNYGFGKVDEHTLQSCLIIQQSPKENQSYTAWTAWLSFPFFSPFPQD